MSIPKQTRNDSKEVDDFDISILKTLPRQLIGEAVSYIKNKKHLEELEAIRKKKEDEEKLSKVKCIPPWAKTLAGERKPDERKDVATQYEINCEGRDGERAIEGSGENEDLKHDSDIGGDSGGEEGFHDSAMREYSEEEEEAEWKRKMEEEGKEMGESGSSDLEDDVNGGLIGRSGKLKGDRDASGHEALEEGDGTGEDIPGKYGSKERGIDEDGNELGDEDRDKTEKQSDGSRKSITDDEVEKHEKGSVSSSKDEEAIDGEHRKKTTEGGEGEDETLDVEHGEHDGDSLQDQEEGKEMSDSDYEKTHTESSGGELKADGISSEFTEGGGTRGGSTEFQGEGEMEAGDEQEGAEGTIEENVEERMGNDSKYLKKHFGNYLVKALAEIAWKRPADPIHYLAHRLYHFRHIEEMTVKNHCEEKEIQEARMVYAMEKQEEIEIAAENIDEDEELEEAEVVAETVQEFQDVQEYSTSGDDVSQFMLDVEPEERTSPVELGF